MIIQYDSLFGFVRMVIFQLAERIAITEKSMKSVLGYCIDMLRFSYLAIPTRHEVQQKL